MMSPTAAEKDAAIRDEMLWNVRRGIRDFAERVNRRAEAEMRRTGTLGGAYRRAIQAELAALDTIEEK